MKEKLTQIQTLLYYNIKIAYIFIDNQWKIYKYRLDDTSSCIFFLCWVFVWNKLGKLDALFRLSLRLSFRTLFNGPHLLYSYQQQCHCMARFSHTQYFITLFYLNNFLHQFSHDLFKWKWYFAIINKNFDIINIVNMHVCVWGRVCIVSNNEVYC